MQEPRETTTEETTTTTAEIPQEQPYDVEDNSEDTESAEGRETVEEEQTEDPDEEGYDFGHGIKFKTQKEALEYERELRRKTELELVEANAYRQAAVDFRQPQYSPPVQQQAPDPAALEQEFYSNPLGTMEKMKNQVKQEVMTAQQERAEDERVWNHFVSEHPELADFREEVTAIVLKEPQLFATVSRTKGEKAALALAAQKIKSKWGKLDAMKKPKKELGKDKSVTTTTTQSRVTQKAAPEKTLSMAEQMAKLQEKRRR